jgi:hypothetical protein
MDKIGSVRSALEGLSGNPSDTNLQNQYTAHLQASNDALILPQLNTFTVREAKLIDDLDLELLVGEELRARLRDAIAGVAITPRTAFDAVAQLHDTAVATLRKIQKVSSGLTELGVDVGGPSAGEVELGLYIPRDQENLSLEQILEEGDELNELVKLGYETVEGKPHSPEVTYLTSSDYGYLLQIAPAVVWFILCVIEKALDIRKKWAEDRELFRKSRDLGHDEETLSALEAKQEAKRTQELEGMIRISIEEQQGVDQHRKHEIVTRMTKSIRLLIDKHETGSYIDVRVGDQKPPPADAETPPPKAELEALKEKLLLLSRIEQVSQRIHALERRGGSEMKTLPAPRP